MKKYIYGTPSEAEAEEGKQLIEPLWYLRSIPYSQYTTSHHWKKRAAEFIAERFGDCPFCELCGTDHVQTKGEDGDELDCDWIPKFHVHHISYEHLGYEDDNDLKLLCSACHNAVHKPQSRAAQFWVSLKQIDPASVKALLPTNAP